MGLRATNSLTIYHLPRFCIGKIHYIILHLCPQKVLFTCPLPSTSSPTKEFPNFVYVCGVTWMFSQGQGTLTDLLVPTRSAAFYSADSICFNTKQATLIRRSTVLNPPLRSVPWFRVQLMSVVVIEMKGITRCKLTIISESAICKKFLGQIWSYTAHL